jgi:hypothetical protein
MLDLTLTVTALTVLVLVALTTALVAVVAGVAPAVVGNRRARLARHESSSAATATGWPSATEPAAQPGTRKAA